AAAGTSHARGGRGWGAGGQTTAEFVRSEAESATNAVAGTTSVAVQRTIVGPRASVRAAAVATPTTSAPPAARLPVSASAAKRGTRAMADPTRTELDLGSETKPRASTIAMAVMIAIAFAYPNGRWRSEPWKTSVVLSRARRYETSPQIDTVDVPTKTPTRRERPLRRPITSAATATPVM